MHQAIEPDATGEVIGAAQTIAAIFLAHDTGEPMSKEMTSLIRAILEREIEVESPDISMGNIY